MINAIGIAKSPNCLWIAEIACVVIYLLVRSARSPWPIYVAIAASNRAKHMCNGNPHNKQLGKWGEGCGTVLIGAYVDRIKKLSSPTCL